MRLTKGLTGGYVTALGRSSVKSVEQGQSSPHIWELWDNWNLGSWAKAFNLLGASVVRRKTSIKPETVATYLSQAGASKGPGNQVASPCKRLRLSASMKSPSWQVSCQWNKVSKELPAISIFSFSLKFSVISTERLRQSCLKTVYFKMG